jgi:3',5'-cyclic AMP phosphodiesterase CpdA
MNRKLIVVLGVFLSAIAYAQPACAQSLSHPNAVEIGKLNETSCASGFSFVVMGDNHVNQDVFEDMRDAAIRMKVDFAISVGDITNNGKEDEYATYLGQIAKAPFPWFVAPGNHEYRDMNGHTSQAGKTRFRKIFGKSDFAFTHCGWKFIGIDIVAYDGMLPGQMKFIESELKGYEGRAVVFMHYPPAAIKNWEESFWNTKTKEFMTLMEKDKVQYFFAGHLHIFDRIVIGPTTYIITGGGGGGVESERPKNAYNSPFGGAYYHFVYVMVNNDKATDFVVRPEKQ